MQKALVIPIMFVLFGLLLFWNIAYADTVIYNVARNNGYLIGNAGGVSQLFVGEKVTSTSSLKGQTFNKITVYLNRCAGCTAGGTVYIGVWNASISPPTAANAKKVFATMNKSALAEVATAYTFQFSPAWTISSGEIIGVGEFTSPNQLATVGFNSANSYNGSATLLSRYPAAAGPWTDETLQEFAMILTLTSGAPNIAGVDTNGDGVPDLFFTDCTDIQVRWCNDGVPDTGSNPTIAMYRTAINATEAGFQWNCAFGYGSCTNHDAKTNGVGLMYLGIIIVISYALLVAVHLKAAEAWSHQNKVHVVDYLRINPVLIVSMLIVDIGLAFYLGFVADIIFFTMIAVMAGLAGFGVYRQATGSRE